MSKISEQKALEAYPICNCYNEQCMMQEDVNFELRTGYEEGFDQAFTYFMEKAVSFIINCTTYDGLGYKAKCVESIFPELKEPEDERIRKGLIKGLSAMRDIHKHQTFSDDAIDIDDAIAWLEKQDGKKPAEWSKDDEHCIELLLPIIDSSSLIPKNRKKCKEFLKSLKDRVQPQPKQEWGAEDESMLTRCIGILGKCYMKELPNKVEEELIWLKSIKNKIQPNYELSKNSK